MTVSDSEVKLDGSLTQNCREKQALNVDCDMTKLLKDMSVPPPVFPRFCILLSHFNFEQFHKMVFFFQIVVSFWYQHTRYLGFSG